MSKMGQLVHEMQEDAYEMSRDQFVGKYGNQNAEIYDNIEKPEPEIHYEEYTEYTQNN